MPGPAGICRVCVKWVRGQGMRPACRVDRRVGGDYIRHECQSLSHPSVNPSPSITSCKRSNRLVYDGSSIGPLGCQSDQTLNNALNGHNDCTLHLIISQITVHPSSILKLFCA